MKEIDGGICAVRGVRAGGIKSGKMGLAVILAEGTAAGVFTRNKVIAAPNIITRERIQKSGHLGAIIANSGNANAFTGETGLADAKEMSRILYEETGIAEELIAVASTGVIGRKLDVGWIREHACEVVRSLSSSPEGSNAAEHAIMTTDIVPKESAVELECGVRIGGIAKGSGMIEPDMGTMLAFIYTDADLSADVLNRCLRTAVDKSFNMIVVDGDTSTNDMVLLTATASASIEPVIGEFQAGLDHVLTDLAKMIARDGEGATKLIEARVMGAKTESDARLAAKAVVRSPLVKSAVFGKDPNWGRVVAATGYSGAIVEQDRISLSFGSGGDIVHLVERGKILDPTTNATDALKKIMEKEEVVIMVDLGMGDKNATAWGCDLTYDYVHINAKYTT
ncbi:MAG: bifunctional ornithine acetyltransferase/N-acetylglutamate synthase [Methanosarcinaceae archaeon]|nr:bifunctional ornithine acetyltransferase/N-acetylglutamate synthase [Methanosarcinaceae archaeon]